MKRDWFVVDATDTVLGRLAAEIARRLRGKHKPIYTPHVDTGDFVVVVNAETVRLTGRKLEQKVYHRHTGWPGGLKTTTAGKVLGGAHPERVLEVAVRRDLRWCSYATRSQTICLLKWKFSRYRRWERSCSGRILWPSMSSGRI